MKKILRGEKLRRFLHYIVVFCVGLLRPMRLVCRNNNSTNLTKGSRRRKRWVRKEAA